MSDGLFRSELNSFLKQELAEDGYSGVEVRVTPTRTEIIILATRTQNVLGEKGRRIRELTAVVQKRFNFPEGTVEVCMHYSMYILTCIYTYMNNIETTGKAINTMGCKSKPVYVYLLALSAQCRCPGRGIGKLLLAVSATCISLLRIVMFNSYLSHAYP